VRKRFAIWDAGNDDDAIECVKPVRDDPALLQPGDQIPLASSRSCSP
jgi:hypothetical protein